MVETSNDWLEFDRWLFDLEWMLKEVRRFQAIGEIARANSYLQHIAWTINQRLEGKNDDA